MNLIARFLLVTILSFVTFSAQARDTKHYFQLSEALNSPVAKGKISSKIKLFFGKSKHPNVETHFGEFNTNKKTNAFNKSDKEACMWVFLSAMIQLQERAKSLNADAIINIKSNYRNFEHSSEETFQCGAGALIAGTAFKGEIVKLKPVVAKVEKKTPPKTETKSGNSSP